jgi:formylglycine-generating enzyme required for sulfatase activity
MASGTRNLAFELGKYEVSQGQWQRVMHSNISDRIVGGVQVVHGNRPLRNHTVTNMYNLEQLQRQHV